MNFEKREQVFINYMNSLANELHLIARYHEKHRVMLGVVFIDIAAQIWNDCIEAKNSSNKSRFNCWCAEFVSVSSPSLEAKDLYDLRCSLLHFGGIPKPFMFEMAYKEECKTQRFSVVTQGYKVKVIPETLISDIANGLIKMIDNILSMYSTGEHRGQTYEEFIDKMVKKIEKEGSFMVMSASRDA